MQIEDHLYEKQLHLPLIGVKLAEMKADEWALLDRRALVVVRMSLTQSVAFNVSKEKTVKDLLIALAGVYEKSSASNSWDTVITSISNATKEKLKFDEVLSAILNQEMMKRSMACQLIRGRAETGEEIKVGVPIIGINLSQKMDMRKNCLSIYDEYKVENWYIDSGASFHCTSHKEWFCDYIKGEFGHVIVENGQKCKIEGRSIIHLKMNDGGKLILKEVRHIPDLQKNLISVNKFDQEGYKITFENSSWKVSRGALTLIMGKAVGTLYPLCTKVEQIVSLTAEKDDKASLWHRRLGHLSENGMRILHSKKVLIAITNTCFDFCEDCGLGKQKRVSFNKDGRKKKSNRLDLVHTDVWGPAQGKSFGGNLYFVIFIDDYSRKTWIYTLKEKPNVFNVFKYWLARVENETGSRLKCLLSDNGEEFCNKEFDSYCAKRGIRRIKTVPRTPQQNGVAERMNRTILE
ncbi:hypothetical protein H6P81_016254 [Aristolochia fimbriata]|uniref:Integrase catalytic domain-containing protein n=1 Tax=Aristolochia fimbriata TaxID=158543 RepID=A0AAV7E8F9_ARIFI|nr:hypothetical protein H6P81_016254 [Aristolochia fimbriata]